MRPLQAQTHKPEGDDTTERRKAALNAVWEGTREVQRGDPVWTYLTLRGIRLTAVPEALRYHRALDYWDEGRLINTFPAMVARVSAPDGLPATLHRTYLMPSGKKAPVSRVKKLMPPAKPGCPTHSAVRLHPAGTTLGIAEGIETALACHLATGIAVWAALSASFMPALVVPENVGKIIIFADNDEGGAGQTAASALARRLLSEGRKVKILAPDTPGTDWADDTAGSDERPWEN
ncbi:MAG TPA: toprim domain-containing protein [Candidatus Obscuribacterales bacterium]